MNSDKDMKIAIERLNIVESSILDLQEEKKEIDSKIRGFKKEKDDTRLSISSFMHENNFSVYVDDRFGEISLRKSPDKYVVKDEDELMNILQEHDKVDDFCETTTKINKRLLNNFFKELRSCDSLPGCVEIEEGSESIVFKSSDSFSKKDKSSNKEIEQKNSGDSFSLEEWDSIG